MRIFKFMARNISQVDAVSKTLYKLINTGNINMKCGGTMAIEAGQGVYLRTKLFDADIETTWTEIVGGLNRKTGSSIDMDADKTGEIDMDAGTINLN